MWKCKGCGKVFPVLARKTIERKPQSAYTNTTRELVERACCPYCECIDIEEVKE